MDSFFDAQTLSTEAITEDADYEGVWVRLRCFLGTARVTVQRGVGFGDVAFTEEIAEYPSLLGDVPTAFAGVQPREQHC